MRTSAKILFCFLVFAVLIGSSSVSSFALLAEEFTEEEQELIESTQKKPIAVGIIPNSFPLSACPPEEENFKGINIDILNLVSRKTGLNFEYVRIPTEETAPYEFLKERTCMFVAGTTNSYNYVNNRDVILSHRLYDGALVFVGRRDTELSNKEGTLRVSVMSGFSAGIDYAEKMFPNYSVNIYSNVEECLDSLLSGKSDVTVVNKYIAGYILQKPSYERLQIINTHSAPLETCIMGLDNDETQTAVSIINKGLDAVSEQEYTYILMNFTIANPYKLTLSDIAYKYRATLVIIVVLSFCLIGFIMKLLSVKKDQLVLGNDKLTGALTESGFELLTSKIIRNETRGVFIVDFDIARFGGYNELYGKECGDSLLKAFVKISKHRLHSGELIGRIYADHFVVLLYDENLTVLIERMKHVNLYFKEAALGSVTINFGIYEVNDKNISVAQMIKCAVDAKRTIKGNDDRYYAVYDNRLYQESIEDEQLLLSFDKALENHEFLTFYQPKYSAQTQKIVGAEALVRWLRDDGQMIQPTRFINLFEDNGQIVRLDFYILDKVCAFQKDLLDNGIEPVPVSVNFSRVHLYNRDVAANILSVVNKYEISTKLIEIECTESTIIEDIDVAKTVFEELKSYGFLLSMDDFGSGYSSLNTLKEISLDIIKLDKGFLTYSSELWHNKAGKIIKSIVALAKDISLKIVAEGVETKEQFEFLRHIGCDTIQGFYFSEPVSEASYRMLIEQRQ